MVPHGWLLVDKPRGMTSHDVIARIRHLVGTRRVGHAGTLDPAAEGLLVVAVGAATKLIDRMQRTDKQYVAHVVLGRASDSGDVEGALQPGGASQPRPTALELTAALGSFVGMITQVPPAHSAIKVGGQALYHRARRGEAVDVPPRTVTIRACELMDYRYPDAIIRIDCSKGVYIRAIARDLGARIGGGGYLHALLRTRIGGFTLAQAWDLATLDHALCPETWAAFALHPDAALADTTAVLLDKSWIDAWYHGRPIPADRRRRLDTQSEARVYDWHGDWVGLAAVAEDASGWQPRQVVRRGDTRSN